MGATKMSLILEVLVLLVHGVLHMAWGETHYYDFVIREANYTRLCSTKTILTVNGQFPGPAMYVDKGDTVVLNAINKGNHNITLHWHGVKQPRNPWSDGPEFITQCPIKPGANFTYNIRFSTEEGTIWWHAHSDWSRATVHGAIIVCPKKGTTHPFPKPDGEMPIILASWYKGDVMEIIEEALRTGGEPNISDAYTINGQPGDLYNCSRPGTFRMLVEYGKSYLLRIINAAMNEELFFSMAQHNLTVVGADGSYTKPFTTSYLMITPGQTMDVLLKADQPMSHYYMAARPYWTADVIPFGRTTTTAILQYSGNYNIPLSPSFPSLPPFSDTDAATNFTNRFRSLADENHPIDVPKTVETQIIATLSLNTLPCVKDSCKGPNGSRLASSMNNISFTMPSMDILQAYYRKIGGVFNTAFPSEPPYAYNFTAHSIPASLLRPGQDAGVKVLEYNSAVEIVLQGTDFLGWENHPMHLHGFSVYLVGKGFGNFDPMEDPKRYNLVDPPLLNTIGVPRSGWAVIRFRANNPGVWFMHCHLERHASWGMSTVLIVKNGHGQKTKMLPPPIYMPPC